MIIKIVIIFNDFLKYCNNSVLCYFPPLLINKLYYTDTNPDKDCHLAAISQ